jgi:signal transduction histidine kinase
MGPAQPGGRAYALVGRRGRRARARVAPGPVRVSAGEELEGRRSRTETEIAAYFTCLQAMQNAGKYAPEAAVQVRLAVRDGHLSFAVSDDGPGFDRSMPGDRSPAGGGTGLVGMEDRIGAAGGELTIESVPGAGTTVRGLLRLNDPRP